LVGVGGFVAFGRCAYIGLMAVAPDAQRGGIGGAVFEEILSRCEAAGCALLLLDASAKGAPLYERFDFRDHGTALSYAVGDRALGPPGEGGGGVDVRPIEVGDAEGAAAIAALDARCYGADRSRLVQLCLGEFRGRGFVARDRVSGELVGYSIGQVDTFGPCMARSTEVARALMKRTLALPFERSVTWLVAGQNREAVRLAESVAGPATGTWRHMRRGDASHLSSDWSSLFGKMSLAVG
jgi:hypothetical protein